MPFLKKIKSLQKVSSFVIVCFLFSLFFATPQRVNAQWPVFDVITESATWTTSLFQGSQFAKEFAGDSIANYIAKTILQRLTAQTVNWINSGFKGNPAFVTNPDKFFLNVGDNIASHYLSLDGPLKNLCSPFKAQVRLALVTNYLNETSNENFSCTLGKIEDNYNSFINDFENGGWDSWFVITQNRQNNPLGVYLDAQNSLSLQIGNEQNNYQKQLDWGKGILSFERCTQKVNVPVMPTLTGTGEVIDVDAPDEELCLEKETVTPGSVINDQLTKALGTTWESLGASDEINEIVAALMQQLTNKVVGGISSGLRGLSNKGSDSTGNSSRTFLEQMVNEANPDSTQSQEFNAGRQSLVPSDLGGTATATPPVPEPPASENPTEELPIIDVRIVPGANSSTNTDDSITQ